LIKGAGSFVAIVAIYAQTFKIFTNICFQVKSEVLGKMYAVLGKRHGRIVSENMVEGSSTFTVTAHLPVVESLQFANEIR
jgi:translation elongation factor EF-G